MHLVNSPSPIIRRHALAALCLAAEPAEVRKLGGNASKQLSAGAYKRGDLFNGMACLQYLTGELSEEELLRDAGDHGYALANAHFTIGMMRLAARDRTGAMKHFEECSDTHTIGSIDYELARAYATRMEAEPDWPHMMEDTPSD